MKTIAFYQPHLDIQGTGVSYYDYALCNQTILGNKSIMIYDKDDHRSHPLVKEKFEKVMQVIALNGSENMNELKIVCKENNVDALYIQKCGLRHDGRYIENIPLFIHVVGVQNDVHGTVYAYVSEWLSEHCSNRTLPFIPYMVNLPDHSETFRSELGFPENAIIFGRTGGMMSWNLPFVNKAIERILGERHNVYFLFANTWKFMSHPRVIFVDAFADLYVKRKFINTCDAMIHAREEGESFGASVAEFSWCNKPVITYSKSWERNHIFKLGDRGIYYSDEESLYNVFKEFNPLSGDFNAYRDCSPDKVMQKFKEVFIDKL